MNRAVLLLWVAASCTSDVQFPGATGVGNPGSLKQVLAPGSEVTVTQAEVYTEAIEVRRCTEDPFVVEINASVDLLGDTRSPADGGLWCSVEVSWRPPLVVSGAAENGEPGKGTLELELDIGQLSLVPTVQPFVDKTALIIELGSPGWFGKESLGLEDGVHVLVEAGHPLHDAFALEVEIGSALYVDADADGVISAAERAAGPVAAGPLHTPDDPDDD